jgi:negative regulator of flagellin synthesis FlgM
MQVNGPLPSNSSNPIQSLRGPVKPAHFYNLSGNRTTGAGDHLTISPEALAKMESTGASSSEMRAQKIAEIRAQLAAGTYETAEKLDVAVDRMLQRIR